MRTRFLMEKLVKLVKLQSKHAKQLDLIGLAPFWKEPSATRIQGVSMDFIDF